jgi:hypothetical protein
LLGFFLDLFGILLYFSLMLFLCGRHLLRLRFLLLSAFFAVLRFLRALLVMVES